MHERLTPENSAFTPADTLKVFSLTSFLVIMNSLVSALNRIFFHDVYDTRVLFCRPYTG